MTDLTSVGTSSTPATGGAATPASSEPAANQSGTTDTNPGGEATSQSAPASTETFTSVDINTLPPELKAVHDNMLRDYKEKTTRAAEERKLAQQWKEKAEAYDLLEKDEDFVKMWNSRGQKPEATPQQTESITDQEFQEALSSKDGFMKLLDKYSSSSPKLKQMEQQLSEANVKIQKQEASETINAFMEAEDDKGNKAYPLFKDLDSHGLLKLFIDQIPNKKPGNYSTVLHQAYGAAEKLYKEIYEKGKSEALGRTQKKAANSSESPTLSTPGGLAPAIDFKGLSNREQAEKAVELALKGRKARV